jgi:hypothetical protein
MTTISRIFLFALVIIVAACDRFWHLEVRGRTLSSLTPSCVKRTLRSIAPDDTVELTTYGDGPTREDVYRFDRWQGLSIYRKFEGDSTTLFMSEAWAGPRPTRGTIAVTTRTFTHVIQTVGKACGAAISIAIRNPE